MNTVYISPTLCIHIFSNQNLHAVLRACFPLVRPGEPHENWALAPADFEVTRICFLQAKNLSAVEICDELCTIDGQSVMLEL
jgi:hypothetical protein